MRVTVNSTHPLQFPNGDYHTMVSVEDAWPLYRKRRDEQLRLICEAANLDLDRVKEVYHTLQRSRNFLFHPCTYILTIRHSDRDNIRRSS